MCVEEMNKKKSTNSTYRFLLPYNADHFGEDSEEAYVRMPADVSPEISLLKIFDFYFTVILVITVIKYFRI